MIFFDVNVIVREMVIKANFTGKKPNDTGGDCQILSEIRKNKMCRIRFN